MPSFHPGQEFLIDYATGSQREPLALLIATHLALCPRCRGEVARYESVGGALIDGLQGESLAADALDHVLARLEADVPEAAVPSAESNAERSDLPRPLRDYVGGDLGRLSWKSRGGLSHVGLLEDWPGYKTRLMRIRAGTAMPMHTHGGTELTLVLSGGFSDPAGHYLRGDVAQADPEVEHSPAADPGEDCLCLAVTDAPLRLTGPFGRYLNFLTRF